jgi:hypothetical protein
MDLKLTPDCIDVPIPRYIKEEDAEKLEIRNQMIDALLLDM